MDTRPPPLRDAPRRRWIATVAVAPLAVAGCTTPPAGPQSDGAAGIATGPGTAPPGRRGAGTPEQSADAAGDALLLDRLSWGATPSTLATLQRDGRDRHLAAQLAAPATPALPAAVQASIDAMTIARVPLPELVSELEQRRRAADAIADDERKKAALQAYQGELNRLGREAATRSMLHALYSPAQLADRMTWFWMNHFSVFLFKANLRALVGDYEQQAIRPHALGRFRDLLGATLRHPAMLRYLDNAQNGVGRINENYARELLELHTMGVGGGYTQADVQELARVLTGVGVHNPEAPAPLLGPARAALHVREGLFEFNPNRHDFGDKRLLGATIRGRGLAEVDEVLDMLARHPATARHVCRRLAMFLVADQPPPALVERLAQRFLEADGAIVPVLQALFAAPEFERSLGGKFKDPQHYVVSAIRMAYDERPIANAAPLLGWLGRLGQAPWSRVTPDGFPLDEAAWSSSGQMAARFEVARAIGSGSAGLFRGEGPAAGERPAFPQLASTLYWHGMRPRLAPATLQALEQAGSPQEWNTFLLASPEFMRR